MSTCIRKAVVPTLYISLRGPDNPFPPGSTRVPESDGTWPLYLFQIPSPRELLEIVAGETKPGVAAAVSAEQQSQMLSSVMITSCTVYVLLVQPILFPHVALVLQASPNLQEDGASLWDYKV